MNHELLLVHELLSVLLIYTVFTRSVRMDGNVRMDVRLAFFCLGVVGCIGVPAPLIWGSIPNPFTVLLLAVIVLLQAVTARYWANGVPLSFYKPGCPPLRRARDERGGCHGHS